MRIFAACNGDAAWQVEPHAVENAKLTARLIGERAAEDFARRVVETFAVGDCHCAAKVRRG